MAKLKNDTNVITNECRFCFMHVFEPHAVEEDQDKKYSVQLLIPKSDEETIGYINQAVGNAKEAGKAKWGGKIPANLKLPLRDGDEDRPDAPEYEGMYFINCSSKTPPGVVDGQLRPVTDQTKVYSGCYGRVSVNFFAFNVSGNKGIACGLNNLQKTADGEAFSGRTKPEDDFDILDGEDDPGEDFL